jgi:hypothetical protein
MFPNGLLSPPLGTYGSDPNVQTDIPNDSLIKQIRFGLYQKASLYGLMTMEIIDFDNKWICNAGHGTVHKREQITFSRKDLIVSTNV